MRVSSPISQPSSGAMDIANHSASSAAFVSSVKQGSGWLG
jgi:hypothetical protein